MQTRAIRVIHCSNQTEAWADDIVHSARAGGRCFCSARTASRRQDSNGTSLQALNVSRGGRQVLFERQLNHIIRKNGEELTKALVDAGAIEFVYHEPSIALIDRPQKKAWSELESIAVTPWKISPNQVTRSPRW
jgi:hypothetical protein